jgi:hypothetical protein
MNRPLGRAGVAAVALKERQAQQSFSHGFLLNFSPVGYREKKLFCLIGKIVLKVNRWFPQQSKSNTLDKMVKRLKMIKKVLVKCKFTLYNIC